MPDKEIADAGAVGPEGHANPYFLHAVLVGSIPVALALDYSAWYDLRLIPNAPAIDHANDRVTNWAMVLCMVLSGSSRDRDSGITRLSATLEVESAEGRSQFPPQRRWAE